MNKNDIQPDNIFVQKSKFCPKIEIVFKNRNVEQKSKFDHIFAIWSEFMTQKYINMWWWTLYNIIVSLYFKI